MPHLSNLADMAEITAEQVRNEVAAWVAEHWDPELTVADWWVRLADAGYSSPMLPESLGGRGYSRDLAIAVTQALASAKVVGPPTGLGLMLAAPTIAAHGNPDQQARYIRRILDGRDSWCQLFSEPGAGSDLAGLRTIAERDGDEYVITGQKVWTSGGQWADYGMLIARTDSAVPKHQGISYFAFDMHQPGVEVRPLREMTGHAMFNEVFIDEARVSADDLIGGLNNGWAVANTTLMVERASLGSGGGGGMGTAIPGSVAKQLTRRVGDFVGTGSTATAASVGMGTVTRFTGGDIATIIPDVIDSATDQINLGLQYREDKYFVQGGYYGSLYRNHVYGMSWTNWASPTVNSQMMSSAPSNQFHQLNLTGGYNFTPATRLVGSVSYGRNTQNDGFLTDTNHTDAKILEVRADRIQASLAAGRVPVVAGAQGVSTDHDVTFLGRGGSDTTAVALAKALNADACELYTDVSGVYTTDPRVVESARKMNVVTFDELLEMTATGCPKPAMRSVEYAIRHGVKLHVRSAFTWEPGTWVVEEDPNMEHATVRAITHDMSEAKVTVSGVEDRPGVAARLFRALAEESVVVDMIVQNASAHGVTDISFTVPHADLERSMAVVADLQDDLGIKHYEADHEVARVSVIGAGMKSNPGIAASMFECLADAGINIDMISTSAIRISCVVAQDEAERAVAVLHSAYELDTSAY